MSLNKIAVRTNKGEYVGGEKIYGAVYLWICSTEACRAVKLKFKGTEKCEWEYRDVVEQNGRLEEIVLKKSYRKDKFRAEGRLVEYEDGIPMGCYAYPFIYSLQQDLPASFKDSGFHGINKTDKWEGEIQYTVSAEVEMLQGSESVLQDVQPIIINKSLPLTEVQGETFSDKTTIKICCCIPRGDVSISACLDKKAYTSGETAQLHVDTKNTSSVDINSFVVKLVRVVTLWPKDRPDYSGSHEENTAPVIKSPCIPDNILNIKNEGCSSKSTKTSDVSLVLKSESTNENLQPSTDGDLVKSIYHVDAGLEIDYAFPVAVQLPVTIQAPRNKKWHDWEPPEWFSCNINIVNGSGPFAVPEQLLGSRHFAHVPGFQNDPFS